MIRAEFSLTVPSLPRTEYVPIVRLLSLSLRSLLRVHTTPEMRLFVLETWWRSFFGDSVPPFRSHIAALNDRDDRTCPLPLFLTRRSRPPVSSM